jgi:hypothetical protein
MTVFSKTRFEKEKASALSDTEANSRIAGLGSFAIAGILSETATWQKGGSRKNSTSSGTPIYWEGTRR